MHHRPVSFWAGGTPNQSIKERPMDEVVEERLDDRLTEQCIDECFDDDTDADDGFEL
jgi:hypothetical protein